MRALGARGPEISAVGLGGWEAGGGRTWGANDSDAEVIAALRTGFDQGATWIDTAEVYAQGRSEEVVGRAVEGYDDVRVFTKIGPQPDGTGVWPDDVARAAERSLRRLGRDVIDLYQVHWRDPAVPVEETWGAMAELVDRGLVRWIGVSNFAPDDVERCATVRHVDAVQPQGSLLYTDELDALLPLTRDLGTGVICYGSLAYGLLAGGAEGPFRDWRSGTYGMDDFFVAENYDRFFSPAALPRQQRRVAAVREVARELGLSVAQAALAWLLGLDGVTGVIAGSRSAEHVADNVGAATLALSASDRDRLAAAAL
jgi:methylglyoxal reductase